MLLSIVPRIHYMYYICTIEWQVFLFVRNVVCSGGVGMKCTYCFQNWAIYYILTVRRKVNIGIAGNHVDCNFL